IAAVGRGFGAVGWHGCCPFFELVVGSVVRRLAAVFLVKIRICSVKNARKMSNLAVLFALHLRIFPQKTASQAF
ncbi:hypothetical protein, partial [Neisseria dentiae]|uniref:hypothetical protein n=1 Tax=Neisseria dentiae TaxID=194197 RepID=UPI0035A16CE9